MEKDFTTILNETHEKNMSDIKKQARRIEVLMKKGAPLKDINMATTAMLNIVDNGNKRSIGLLSSFSY